MNRIIRLAVALALAMAGLMALSTPSQADAKRDPNLYSYSNFIVTGDFAVIYYCSHKDTAPIHSAIPGQNSRKDCEDGNFIELSVGSEDHIRCTHASNGSTFRADGVAGTLKRVDFPSYAGRFYCKNLFKSQRAATVASKPKPTPIGIPGGGAGIPIPGSPWTPHVALMSAKVAAAASFTSIVERPSSYYSIPIHCSAAANSPVKYLLHGQNSQDICPGGNFMTVEILAYAHLNCYQNGEQVFYSENDTGQWSRIDYLSYAGKTFCTMTPNPA